MDGNVEVLMVGGVGDAVPKCNRGAAFFVYVPRRVHSHRHNSNEEHSGSLGFGDQHYERLLAYLRLRLIPQSPLT